MLPCNSIVYVNDAGKTVVSVVDPIVTIGATNNSGVTAIAAKVRNKLKRVIAQI